MENETAKRDRITELKNKIYYAETAKETYRGIHAILYETNSLYVDALKQELSDLEYLEEA